MSTAAAQRKILPPAWFLLSLIAAASMHRYVPVATLFTAPLRYFGVALIVCGLALAVVAARLFTRHDTAIKPFEPSTALVTTGVYRFTRNPMYLSMLMILAGAAWYLGTAGAFAPLPVLALILDQRFVRHEEAMLEQTFGASYADYRRRVRRWL